MSEKTASFIVKRMPISELKPHGLNPRTHPEKGSELWNVLAGSLSHDYFDPIVFNAKNNLLVSGHLRTKVLKDLGFTHADCVIVDYPENIHLARMLAANKLIGENLNDGLKEILLKLDAGDLSMDLSGYTEGEVETLMNQIHQEDNESNESDGKSNSTVICPKCKHSFSILKEVK